MKYDIIHITIDIFYGVTRRKEERLLFMLKRIICGLLLVSVLGSAVACSGGLMGVFTGDETTETTPPTYIPPVDDGGNGEENKNPEKNTGANATDRVENPFVSADKHPLSTVSLNASRATYYYFRNLVNKDYTLSQLQKCSYDFKIEEFLNYFGFKAPNPVSSAVFGFGSDMMACPWNEDSALLRFTFKTRDLTSDAPNNFVFHIDVTESMAREDVLPLFKQVFDSFASALDSDDVVSVVLCSANEEIIVDGYSKDKSDELVLAINSIEIGQGTNTGASLGVAFSVAKKHYIEGGNNLVVMVSDGDVSEKLCSEVKENAEDGIYTSVLGFGDSNHKNAKLEKLADAGSGRYFYIDGVSRGEYVLGKELFVPATVLADDVKIDVNFNSDYVSEYRLIGYVYQGEIDEENSQVVPVGKIYSGDSITLCYEVKLTEEAYEKSREFASARLTYKNYKADEDDYSQSLSVSTGLAFDDPDDDTVFMSAVIKTVMILQKSEHIGKLTVNDVLADLREMNFEGHPEREEFRALLEKIVAAKK